MAQTFLVCGNEGAPAASALKAGLSRRRPARHDLPGNGGGGLAVIVLKLVAIETAGLWIAATLSLFPRRRAGGRQPQAPIWIQRIQRLPGL
jgi:hypothetical protein